MATGTVTQAPIYTGNNVLIRINGQLVGFVETLSITRNVNRRPTYQVGSPLWVDAPVTQASITVTATNMVPLQGQSNSGKSLAQLSIVPSGSLSDQVTAGTYDMEVVDQNGRTVYYIQDAYYNQDAVQVPGTDILTINCSWVARDSMAWT